jgi:hypothetical protein
MRLSSFGAFALALFAWLRPDTLRAQWVTQSIPLRPGWNAVHLQVTPAETDCDRTFAAWPEIRGVWRFDRRLPALEFTESPTAVLHRTEHWRVWFPGGSPDSFLRTLQGLEGGQAYLVEVDPQAPPRVWTVKGTPAWKEPPLLPGALNLVGLPITPDRPPNFLQFFRDSTQIEVGPGSASGIFAVGVDGREEPIRQPARASIQSGAAYWIRAGAAPRRLTPLEITGNLTAAGSLDFGTDQRELGLVLANHSPTNPLTLTLTPRPSEPAPPGTADVAGDVPLAYLEASVAGGRFRWVPLDQPWSFDLAPGAQREIRLSVRRNAFASYRTTAAAGAAYQSLLEIVEAPHGVRLLIPVVAETDVVRRLPLARALTDGLPVYHPNQGLWVGQVSIDRVSRSSPGADAAASKDLPPPASTDLPVPLPVASPLGYRVLVHVDETGQGRLLQRVVLASRTDGTNDQIRLYQDEARVPGDAKTLSRISSTAFPLMAPLPLTGAFAQALEAQVALDYDDPVNPFKHAYHPDHDNLVDGSGTNKLAAGAESFSVTRDVRFDFRVAHPTDDGGFLPTGPVVDLDGTNQCLALDPLGFGGDFTLMAWIRVDPQAPSPLPVFELGGNATGDRVALSLDGPTGPMNFAVTAAGVPSRLLTPTNFPTARWVHVAAVNDGNGTARIYWNGNLVAEGPQAPAPDGTRTNNWVGRDNADTPAYFQGRLYDLVVWDDARDLTAVREDMLLFQGDTPGRLVAYFPAQDGQGTTLADAGGSGLQARLVGASWDQSELPPIPFWGVARAEGLYREVIRGLRPTPIVLKGTFQLERLNRDPALE